ncbi:MAG: nucleoside hydrolase [Bacteroidetes bacterium]|nr:nucleoside hydrolase [Bacteroidota bacterium]
MSRKYKIIFDTDPGVDDTMAIYSALRSPQIDIIGLTTIFGNVDVDLATENALRILEIAGRTDIPVVKGAKDPLAGFYSGPVPFVHGDNGQSNIDLAPPTTKAKEGTAAQFIIDQVMKNSGEIVLVAVGPLTNLALALRLQPDIADHVKEVILMGGNALCPGNATPASEANIHNDPEAADLVFSAGWPVTMVGLDVTHKVNMSNETLARFGTIDDPLALHISKIIGFYRDFFESELDVSGIYVHDSSAVAYLLDRSLFTTASWPIKVDTSEGVSRGKTWPSMANTDKKRAGNALPAWHSRPKVNVCIEVKGEQVVKLLMNQTL